MVVRWLRPCLCGHEVLDSSLAGKLGWLPKISRQWLEFFVAQEFGQQIFLFFVFYFLFFIFGFDQVNKKINTFVLIIVDDHRDQINKKNQHFSIDLDFDFSASEPLHKF